MHTVAVAEMLSEKPVQRNKPTMLLLLQMIVALAVAVAVFVVVAVVPQPRT